LLYHWKEKAEKAEKAEKGGARRQSERDLNIMERVEREKKS